MSKSFKFKKKRKKYKISKFSVTTIIKLVLFIILIILCYHLVLKYAFKYKISIDNTAFLNNMVKNANHHIESEYPLYSTSSLINYFTDMDILDPSSIFKNPYKESNSSILSFVYNDEYDGEKLSEITDHIKDPNKTEVKKPIVYIYNTHQLENYTQSNNEAYNIKPNVMMTSYMIREKLNGFDIPTIVEESNVTDLILSQGFRYSQSYKVSRQLILQAQKKDDTIKYLIDIHRDSAKKKTTTITIKDKTYARILFVVGLEHKNNKANLKLAKDLNEIIKRNYPKLSRGIITKAGKGVDGIYNQDLSENAMLIEFGGVDNTIDEVNNTAYVVANALKEYIGDLNEN
ncbi:MAG: stage II sporulation protein P [Bacilli bacterium]